MTSPEMSKQPYCYDSGCGKKHILLSIHDVGTNYESVQSALEVRSLIPEAGLSIIFNSHYMASHYNTIEAKCGSIGVHLNPADEGIFPVNDYNLFGREGWLYYDHRAREKGTKHRHASLRVDKFAGKIRQELERQIDLASAFGFDVSYVDFHNMFQKQRRIQRAYLDAAANKGLAAVWAEKYMYATEDRHVTGDYIDELNANEFSGDMVFNILTKVPSDQARLPVIHFHANDGIEPVTFSEKQCLLFSGKSFVREFKKAAHIISWDHYRKLIYSY
jgi:hypothetical protein